MFDISVLYTVIAGVVLVSAGVAYLWHDDDDEGPYPR